MADTNENNKKSRKRKSPSAFPIGSLLKNTRPDLYRQLKPEFNPGIDLNKITHGSRAKLVWCCTDHKTCDKHIWTSTVNNRTRGKSCPWSGCCKTQHDGSKICQCLEKG